MPRNFDSSFLTQKRQAEEIYANYIVTNQKINQGCTTRGFFQQGAAGTFSSQQITEVNEGANLIGATLRDSVINAPQNLCPVNLPPPPAFILPTSGADVLAFSRSLSSTLANFSTGPTSGADLTINGNSVGNFDYTVYGSTAISSFIPSNWFTSTQDSAWAFIIINGDLTIDAGQTFIPSVRKLCTVLYVTGNLVCNGTISMTARGANHSGTGNSGGSVGATNLRIGTGTFSAVTNPQIPAAGGAGATGSSTDNLVVNGSAGTSGGLGGGGAGGKFGGTGRGGNGAAGTSFSGGGGGGGMLNSSSNGGDAVANGGKGGDGTNSVSAGGSGNPGGTGTGLPNGPDGNVGTGGTLIVIVEGTLSGNGSIVSNGVDGARASGQVGGGGSGGGSVTILFKTDSSTITPVASGGVGSSCGSGGAGTARKLAIGSN